MFQSGVFEYLKWFAICSSVFLVFLGTYRRSIGNWLHNKVPDRHHRTSRGFMNFHPRPLTCVARVISSEGEAELPNSEIAQKAELPNAEITQKAELPNAGIAPSVSPEERAIRSRQALSENIRRKCKSLYRVLMFCEREEGNSLPIDLLPGLMNNATLPHIVTQLPWVTQQSLIRVSRAWYYAIKTYMVFDSRVLAGATETLVVFVHDDSKGKLAMSLYNIKEKVFHQLPPIVQDGHIEDLSKVSDFVSVDGKICLFGAYCLCDPVSERCSKRDCDRQGYMLDLAGHSGWWERFTVYDRGLNTRHGRICFADKVYKNVFAYNRMFMPSGKPSKNNVARDDVHIDWVAAVFSKRQQKHFTMNGKPYFMDMRGRTQRIEAMRNRREFDSRQHLHSISCGDIVPEEAVRVFLTFVLPVNGELLTLARWERNNSFEYCLLQSKGFGTTTKEIMWQREASRSHFDLGTCFPLCLTEL